MYVFNEYCNALKLWQTFQESGGYFRTRPTEEGEELCAKIDRIFANWIVFFFTVFWVAYFATSANQYYL
jgi:hypothetical protein